MPGNASRSFVSTENSIEIIMLAGRRPAQAAQLSSHALLLR
jgi:hypothetical protein